MRCNEILSSLMALDVAIGVNNVKYNYNIRMIIMYSLLQVEPTNYDRFK